MDVPVFRALFLALFGLGPAIELFLNFLNRRESLRHASLPSRFTGPLFAAHFNPETFDKARAYTLERLSFDSFSVLYSAAITLVLLFSGILPWSDRLLAGVFGEGLHGGVLFLGGVTGVQSLSRLPLTVYSTFRIEGRYGFNTMTWDLFRRDLFKGLALSAVLGAPILYAVFALMRFLGSVWWVWAFGLVLVFQIVLLILYPVFIAPWFNRFQPLQDGDLKRALLDLASRLRFPAGGILVMDGSSRSLHSNAYFSGFGRFRRIVLFDTLLRHMDKEEILGVLAHEIGHYKLGHLYKRMAIQIITTGVLFWMAALALRWPALYAAFGFDTVSTEAPATSSPFAGSPGAGLFLFMTLLSTLSILVSPLQNLLSRRHEYQADAFAVAAVRSPAAMQTALIKLSTRNLSNLTPHPWYSAFHNTHPTLSERLEAIGQLRPPVGSGGRASRLPIRPG